jgi:hypothetical protein
MRFWLPCCITLALSLLACGGIEGDEIVCAAGDTQACHCTDGTEGIQACLADGMGWDCCQCDDSCGTGDDDDSSDPLGVDP